MKIYYFIAAIIVLVVIIFIYLYYTTKSTSSVSNPSISSIVMSTNALSDNMDLLYNYLNPLTEAVTVSANENILITSSNNVFGFPSGNAKNTLVFSYNPTTLTPIYYNGS